MSFQLRYVTTFGLRISGQSGSVQATWLRSSWWQPGGSAAGTLRVAKVGEPGHGLSHFEGPTQFVWLFASLGCSQFWAAFSWPRAMKAFYELHLQLAAGRVLRDYVALCHGWLVGRSAISAPVSWQVSEQSEPGELSFLQWTGEICRDPIFGARAEILRGSSSVSAADSHSNWAKASDSESFCLHWTSTFLWWQVYCRTSLWRGPDKWSRPEFPPPSSFGFPRHMGWRWHGIAAQGSMWVRRMDHGSEWLGRRR